jgi:hypothetical protein
MAQQQLGANLTLTFTHPNIANVIGSPSGNTFTGNSRDNQFTLSGGNNTLSGGGGFDTYIFTGSQFGINVITDPPGSHRRAELPPIWPANQH